jgi:hypothetical protein
MNKITRVSSKPMRAVQLRGTVGKIGREPGLNLEPGIAITWKMKDLNIGFHDMTKDVETIRPYIKSLNLRHKAPELSISNGECISLYSTRTKDNGALIESNGSLELKDNNSLLIKSSLIDNDMLKPFLTNSVPRQEINISNSRVYLKSMPLLNGTEDKNRTWTIENPLSAIRMDIRYSDIAFAVVSFRLFLKDPVGKLYNNNGLWPIMIEKINGTVIENETHELSISVSKKD